eukprot:5913612-Prymnesium_polylepis.1
MVESYSCEQETPPHNKSVLRPSRGGPKVVLRPRRHYELAVLLACRELRQPQRFGRRPASHCAVPRILGAVARAREAIAERVRGDKTAEVGALGPERIRRERRLLARRVSHQKVGLAVKAEHEVRRGRMLSEPIALGDERAAAILHLLRRRRALGERRHGALRQRREGRSRLERLSSVSERPSQRRVWW